MQRRVVREDGIRGTAVPSEKWWHALVAWADGVTEYVPINDLTYTDKDARSADK